MNKEEKSVRNRSTEIGRDAIGNIINTGDVKVFIGEGEKTARNPQPKDPQKYLRDLQANTSFIDIRGLQVGSGKATRFPINELYITLTTTDAERGALREGFHGEEVVEPPRDLQAATERGPQRVELQEMLQHRRLVIVGDPG
jgi:hypothetical protein